MRTDTIKMEHAEAREILDALVEDDSLELPLLPKSSSRILTLCQDPNCPPRDLVETIRNDQSLATHLLRITNSAIYSAETRIVSLQQAVARLGLHRIREIVLVISCQGRVFDAPGFEDQIRHSMSSSLACAAFAQEIARARRLNVEDAFLCGLLHDIGRPVLLQAAADYQRKNNITFDSTDLIDAVEHYRPSVGGKLITAWNLPHSVANAVIQQRLPDEDLSNMDAQILNLAIAFTASLLDPDTHDSAKLKDHPMIEQLNIYPDQLALLMLKGEEILDFVEKAQ